MLTPTNGDGPCPILAGDEVDGAATGHVVLSDGADGPVSWAWREADTQVRVGFVTPPGLEGPQVREGMVWPVLAVNDQDASVAQSRQRPISP